MFFLCNTKVQYSRTPLYPSLSFNRLLRMSDLLGILVLSGAIALTLLSVYESQNGFAVVVADDHRCRWDRQMCPRVLPQSQVLNTGVTATARYAHRCCCDHGRRLTLSQRPQVMLLLMSDIFIVQTKATSRHNRI